MLRKIALGVVVLVAAFLLYATTRPDTFEVERTATIQAPPERLFVLIDDFHRWGAWSPWEKIDPGMKRTYSGNDRGTGAVYEWDGNSDIGKGRMEIVKSSPPSSIAIDLHFIEPFEGRNTADFTLVPQGDSTQVTWAMHGPSTFTSKLIGIFLNMDEMIGGQFERGLANLKSLVEQS